MAGKSLHSSWIQRLRRLPHKGSEGTSSSTETAVRIEDEAEHKSKVGYFVAETCSKAPLASEREEVLTEGKGGTGFGPYKVTAKSFVSSQRNSQSVHQCGATGERNFDRSNINSEIGLQGFSTTTEHEQRSRLTQNRSTISSSNWKNSDEHETKNGERATHAQFPGRNVNKISSKRAHSDKDYPNEPCMSRVQKPFSVSTVHPSLPTNSFLSNTNFSSLRSGFGRSSDVVYRNKGNSAYENASERENIEHTLEYSEESSSSVAPHLRQGRVDIAETQDFKNSQYLSNINHKGCCNKAHSSVLTKEYSQGFQSRTNASKRLKGPSSSPVKVTDADKNEACNYKRPGNILGNLNGEDYSPCYLNSSLRGHGHLSCKAGNREVRYTDPSMETNRQSEAKFKSVRGQYPVMDVAQDAGRSSYQKRQESTVCKDIQANYNETFTTFFRSLAPRLCGKSSHSYERLKTACSGEDGYVDTKVERYQNVPSIQQENHRINVPSLLERNPHYYCLDQSELNKHSADGAATLQRFTLSSCRKETDLNDQQHDGPLPFSNEQTLNYRKRSFTQTEHATTTPSIEKHGTSKANLPKMWLQHWMRSSGSAIPGNLNCNDRFTSHFNHERLDEKIAEECSLKTEFNHEHLDEKIAEECSLKTEESQNGDIFYYPASDSF